MCSATLYNKYKVFCRARSLSTYYLCRVLRINKLITTERALCFSSPSHSSAKSTANISGSSSWCEPTKPTPFKALPSANMEYNPCGANTVVCATSS